MCVNVCVRILACMCLNDRVIVHGWMYAEASIFPCMCDRKSIWTFKYAPLLAFLTQFDMFGIPDVASAVLFVRKRFKCVMVIWEQLLNIC